MKSLIKRTVGVSANTPGLKSLLRASGRLGQALTDLSAYAERQATMSQSTDVKQHLIATLFPDMTVRHGPFKGLVYPTAEATGSALLAKLLGSYELELSETFETLFKTPYSGFVDIGCAEGYYAVGGALRLTETKIYAFDTEAYARELCAELARANGVEDQVEIGGYCTAETLRGLNLGERALILSDCEGFEAQLFTEDLIADLTAHDFVVECHDFDDPTVAKTLVERFSKTHDIDIITSLDDHWKARKLDYPELEGLPPLIRRFVVEENRAGMMEWLIARSRR